MDKERLFRYLDRKYSSKNEIIPNIPLGEDADAIWAEVLQGRRERGTTLPLTNLNGDAYWYILTSRMISASEVIVEELMEQETTAELHNSSVSTIEEIYYTGFMEGAQISVQDAMHFLQSGEEPENVEELILLNSRQAAGFAAENMYHAIDSNYLHNLAYFLTEGLDNGSGDFRETDTIEIPSLQGECVQLPPASMIPEQTERFADFLANTGTHPLIKAATAQAWVLAYRPFPEGNERLARLLSNVILIRAGYGFFGEISISSVLAQTSYDYFRAIANILRVENGADLTYFLEYYLVSLSAAVNEMKTRRIQKAEKVVEAEQKLAAVPLQAPETNNTAQHEATPILFSNRDERMETVSAGLDQLMAQGYEQFTLGDLSAVTGISRKILSRLIRPYEESERIIAVRRAKTGNIYAFKQSAPPDEDDAQEELVQQKRPDIDTGHSQYVISASEKKNNEELCIENDDTQDIHSQRITPEAYLEAMRDKCSGKNQIAVAKLLLSYIHNKRPDFSSFDISKELNVSAKTINNYLKMLQDEHVIVLDRMADRINYYRFSDAPAAKPQDETGKEYIEFKLKDIANKNSTKKGKIARILLRYLQEGKLIFQTDEIVKESGYETDKVHNALRPLRESELIERIDCDHNGFHVFSTYRFNIRQETNNDYSDEVMNTIAMLEQSEFSPKDRRIARIIRSCLAKGTVTKEDYSAAGEQTRWKVDTRFAEQLGLLEKVSSSEYRIVKEMGDSYKKLGSAQKCTLSALYDIFGDGMFSAEMVVAQLEYSTSHVSGILHQFTMLKLLDCTPNDNNSYSYQLNVNPADNPECFAEAV